VVSAAFEPLSNGSLSSSIARLKHFVQRPNDSPPSSLALAARTTCESAIASACGIKAVRCRTLRRSGMHSRAGCCGLGKCAFTDCKNQQFGSKKLDKTCENRAKTTRAIARENRAGDYLPTWHYLMAYVRLGDNEQAFASLAKATEERNWFAFQIKVNPILNPLRGDPRFEALVQKVFAPKTGSSP